MADNNRNLIVIQQLLHVQQQQAEDEQAMIALMRRRRRRARRARRRRCWVRPWLGDVRRDQFGHYNQLMVELRREDPASFQNFLRIQPQMFDELLARVGPRITKQDTNYRKALDNVLSSSENGNEYDRKPPPIYIAAARTSWMSWSRPAAAAPPQ